MNARDFARYFLALAVLLGLGASAANAQVQRVGRILIGVPPGGNFDATARLLADRMTKAGGLTFLVENRPGAGQTIAAEAVARAPADGQTLFLSPMGPMVAEPQLNQQTVRYDPFRDFAPISNIATVDLALATGPALRVSSLAEYLAAIRADSNKGFYTSPGANSFPHFFGLLISRQSGARMTHVPYQGPAPAVQAVLGGQVPAMIVGYADVLPLHRAGKVTMLATSGTSRMPLTPEVPSFVELGYSIQLAVWYGVFAPGATPRDVVDQTNKLVVDAVRSKEMTEFLVQSGHRVIGSTPKELADKLRRDYDSWGAFIRDSGIAVK